MPRYAITERAGPFVAGFRNAGVGTVLELSEHQAAHELRLGTLIALDQATVPSTTEETAGDRKTKVKKQVAGGDE